MNSHPIKILKIWIPLATILVLILPFVACGSLKNKGYSIEVELPLAETLYETSGLYCPSDKSFFTINDSGNAPLIYELDINGEIVEEHKIESRNIDWEAISGDDEYFYIGDIGNNNGKRKHVNIIQVSKENFNIPLRMMRGNKPTTAAVLEDWTWAHPTYSFSVSKNVKSVEIDKSNLMADINLENNVLEVE